MIENLHGLVDLFRLGFMSRGIPGAIRRRVRPRHGDRYSRVVSRHLRIAPAMLLLLIAAFWGAAQGDVPKVIQYVLFGVMVLGVGVFGWSVILLNAAIPDEEPRRAGSQSVRFQR